MKARLGADRHGDETLMPVFIFAATFIVIGAFMISIMAPLFASADRGDFTQLKNYEMVGSTGYLVYEPFEGYNVTTANVTDDNDPVSIEIFTNDTVSDREVWMVRDYVYEDDGGLSIPVMFCHKDFFVVHSEWGGFWFHHRELLVFDYATIIANQVERTNQSVTPFKITTGPDEVLIITTFGNYTTFAECVWSNTFNIMVGQPTVVVDLAETSMWAILGQLMTASLPNVSPVMNLLIAVPFNASLGFMVFTVISRMIPWIAGG